MKKLAVFVAAIALTLGLAQCKKEQTPTGTGETVFITLNVGDNNNGTRANVDPAGNQITFENGDQILVASGGKYVGTLTRTDGTFSGEITDPVEGKPLFFYFLGNKIDVSTLTPGTTEECTVNISDQTSELPVISMGRSVAPNNLTQSVDYTSDNDSYTARLYNRCSLMKFNVDTYSTNSTAPICILGLNNEVTVNFADPTDSGFTYGMSKQDCGLIKMPALDAQGVTWAIVLPQDNTKTACCYTDEALASSYCGSFPLMSIGSNILYDGTNGNNAVTLDIRTTRKVDLATIGTNQEVQSGQVMTGTLSGNYKISIADNATVTLSGVSINGGGTVSTSTLWAGLTCLGDATIILAENTTNTVIAFYTMWPGILPGPTGTTLTIKGSGSLDARSPVGYATGLHGAGIGCGAFYHPTNYPGYENTFCGNIRIEGGTIEATGGFNAAGIGAAGAFRDYYSSVDVTSRCGDITITGGTIKAYGGYAAAGIGTGFSTAQTNPSAGTEATSTCGNIIISGGSITATGGIKIDGVDYSSYGKNNAAGIGAGFDGYCPSINIGGTSTGTATGVGDYYSIGGLNLSGNVCCPSVTIFRNSGHHLSDLGHSCSWTSDGVVTILVP
jgi:hypothetical protein